MSRQIGGRGGGFLKITQVQPCVKFLECCPCRKHFCLAVSAYECVDEWMEEPREDAEKGPFWLIAAVRSGLALMGIRRPVFWVREDDESVWGEDWQGRSLFSTRCIKVPFCGCTPGVIVMIEGISNFDTVLSEISFPFNVAATKCVLHPK